MKGSTYDGLLQLGNEFDANIEAHNTAQDEHGRGPSSREAATVTISKLEYESLLKDRNEYHLLRQGLEESGMTKDALAYLVSSEVQILRALYQKLTFKCGGAKLDPSVTPFRWPYSSSTGKSQGKSKEVGRSNFNLDMSMSWRAKPVESDQKSGNERETVDGSSNESRPWQEMPTTSRHVPRQDHTLLFSNLPEGVTHKELTDNIWGGRLVEIWLRDRTAEVTFMEGAPEFLQYAKRNDLYIRQSRLIVSWSNRQFEISTSLVDKFDRGVSRVLVIRCVDDQISETRIRKDLDHVHNLVIIEVERIGSDFYIWTNSALLAQSARQCLLSRLAYKKFKIEWYLDRCSLLPPVEQEKPEPVKSPSRRGQSANDLKKSVSENRFGVLPVDELVSEEFSDSGSIGDTDSPSHPAGVSIHTPDTDATHIAPNFSTVLR